MLRATIFVKNAQGVWNVVYGSSPTSFRSALRIVKLLFIMLLYVCVKSKIIT